jgi:2-dehydro-3-deoxy-D-arabinonate dehydratase
MNAALHLGCHAAPEGFRWALGEGLLSREFRLEALFTAPASEAMAVLERCATGEPATGARVAPLHANHEVWASGVTYLRSRDARQQESSSADVYERVYAAERPELFYKSQGFRVVTSGQAIRLRRDARWSVPEPELVLVVNAHGEIIGYTAGNDVSSRDIEGENPLYLPQAKVYDGSCALGPTLRLLDHAERADAAEWLRRLDVEVQVARDGAQVFSGQTSVSQMKRSLAELVRYLTLELSFPQGVFLMTGTGLVPPETFTLRNGDHVRIRVGEVTLENPVLA